MSYRVCCCSLAGTEACQHCSNNTGSDKNIYYYYSNTDPLETFFNAEPPRKIKPTIQYWCGNCESVLTPHQKYCHNCGREIDWSEIFKDAE